MVSPAVISSESAARQLGLFELADQGPLARVDGLEQGQFARRAAHTVGKLSVTGLFSGCLLRCIKWHKQQRMHPRGLHLNPGMAPCLYYNF